MVQTAQAVVTLVVEGRSPRELTLEEEADLTFGMSGALLECIRESNGLLLAAITADRTGIVSSPRQSAPGCLPLGLPGANPCREISKTRNAGC